MGSSQWERDWNGLHNWESRAHRLHEVIGTQHYTKMIELAIHAQLNNPHIISYSYFPIEYRE